MRTLLPLMFIAAGCELTVSDKEEEGQITEPSGEPSEPQGKENPLWPLSCPDPSAGFPCQGTPPAS